MIGPTNAPTDSPDPRLLAHAYADGELDPANALAFERRRDNDPALAAECAEIMELRRALRENLPRDIASAELRARVVASVGLGRQRTQPSWRALAASVAVAAMVASASTYLALRPDPGEAIAETVLASHRRALMAPLPADVASSDRHTVKPWFNGRIAQAPRVVDLTSEGFPLLGGRIDVIGRAPAPTLIYRHRQHLVSLTQVLTDAPAAAPSRRVIDGYTVLRWSEGGVTYWVVSDLGAADVENFVRAFRAAPAEG